LNCQNEPIFDIVSNLSAIIRSQFPAVKFAQLGWPDRKTFQVEHNLPAIFFADISEKGEHAVSQYAIHSTTSNSITQEKLRLHTMLQMSLFTNDQLTRDQLGWKIKQYFVTNFHIPLLDYTQSTPISTGEYILLKFAGDHKEEKGEANFWQRDLTFIVQSRVLDAVMAYPVGQIIATETIDLSFDVSTSTQTSKSYTTSESESTDSKGNPVTTVTLTKKS
jgi:hypothetical protein